MNMTEGPIVKQIILFSLPLMLGNIFQMLYNTVDMVVVGNYVGKEALAAVGSTSMTGNFVGRIKGAKGPFDLQFLTWDFS